MFKASRPGGYTIVEVMIFLAVSSFMFVIAAFFIQGKQTQAQFSQAMNSINKEVQQVMNDVNDNNYQNQVVSCTITAEHGLMVPGEADPTSSQQCDLMGKIIQFGVGGSPGSYDIYTIAGCQYSDCTTGSLGGSNSSPPTTFSNANAQTIDPGGVDNCGTGSNANISVNLTSCDNLEWGLKATAMYDSRCTSDPDITNSVGFFGSFAANNGSGLDSGSQSVQVVDIGCGINIGGINGNEDESGMVGKINTDLKNVSSFMADVNIGVCFNDGHNHIGALIIGGTSGQHLTTSIKMSDGPIELFSNPQDKCS